ncbi:hypothetical protein SISNIDRAFT_452100 [Sistotremastrum niveocremeum HHB9708]|uniref:RNA-dependent RNA polymerase n=1 Tax=Sistotremastrum niveocremeum HHB9708 TaxID=1314777 RepID=A0A164WYA7_9AGAM|nr:hypothetical protein SISNIDRAFT_452100 [Sistotremastrum niveocremeum HHB9708]
MSSSAPRGGADASHEGGETDYHACLPLNRRASSDTLQDTRPESQEQSQDSSMLWADYGEIEDVERVCALVDSMTPVMDPPTVPNPAHGSYTPSKITTTRRPSEPRRNDSDVTLVSPGSAQGSPLSSLKRTFVAEFSQIASQDSSKRRKIESEDDPENFLGPDEKPAPPSPYNIIAHEDSYQSFMDSNKVPFGVQFEIGRLVSCEKLDWHDIDFGALKKLKGNNEDMAPKVDNLRPKGDVNRAARLEKSSKLPWRELDLEEDAFKRGDETTLGPVGETGWYGGKVEFTGRVHSDSGRRLVVRLEFPELGPSTRFTRKFGSSKFLRIRIPPKIHYQRGNELTEFFAKPFVLLGNVYRTVMSKDGNVYLFRVNDAFRLHSPQSDFVVGLDKLAELFNWHNPMEHNQNQTMAKWSVRMGLGFSNSVPGLLVEASNIFQIDDIVAPGVRAGGKPPSEKIMTDGCGLINEAGMRRLRRDMGWDAVPTAVQMRIGGAKGLFLMQFDDDPSDRETAKVWLRPSQIKINYGTRTQDKSQRIIDVLQPSHFKHPARLSAETIICLSHNGVPNKVFEQIFQDGLNEIVQGLTDWDRPDARYYIWAAVARVGGVVYTRLARASGLESRAMGFEKRDAEMDDDATEANGDVDPETGRSDVGSVDPFSGCPALIEETVLCLLEAGFMPHELPYLATQIKFVLMNAIESYFTRYKVEVKMSAEALIVPDPCNVLAPGQIHIKSSRRLNWIHDRESEQILGPVLVTRHPCKLPSDIQIVEAVYHEKLRQYTDVIIFSTQGDRSLASLLGGGDYDGDKVIAIWEPTIVGAFVKPDNCFADPPPAVSAALIKPEQDVAGVWSKHGGLLHDVLKVVPEVRDCILAPLSNAALVGAYSNYHDYSVYTKGYDHPDTIRLAHMFCAVLDGSKTGVKVASAVAADDKKENEKRAPSWKETEESRLMAEQKNQPETRRPPERPKFIMDRIRETGRKAAAKHLSAFPSVSCSAAINAILTSPWDTHYRDAESAATTGDTSILNAMDQIKAHVEATKREYIAAALKNSPNKTTLKSHKKLNGPPKRSFKTKQDEKRRLSRKFYEGARTDKFPEIVVNQLKASYAYKLDLADSRRSGSEGVTTVFSFQVAMRELCALRAAAYGPVKIMTHDFYERFQLPKGFRS